MLRATQLIRQMQVTVCGGGNVSHAFAGVLSATGYKVNVFASFADEAERITKGCAENGGITVTLPDGSKIKGQPNKISKNAGDVIDKDTQAVLIPLPAFAFPSVLTDIAPHVHDGTTLIACPGQGGFDWCMYDVFSKVGVNPKVTVAAMIQMPYATRVEEFGKHVNIQAKKKTGLVATVPASESQNATDLLSKMFEMPLTSAPHMLSIHLFPGNWIVHTSRLYGLFHDWDGKKTYDRIPLFYEEYDDVAVDIYEKVNAENREIIKALEAYNSQYDLNGSIPQAADAQKMWYSDVIQDPSTTKTVFTSNRGLDGLKAPMIAAEGGGFIPNLSNRYFTEDVPLGICIIRGVADITGTPTPYMNKVITWAQGLLGKEYLVDGKFVGKDIGETAAPQRYGITTMEGLFDASKK